MIKQFWAFIRRENINMKLVQDDSKVYEKVTTEKLNTICLKIVDTFLGKNIPFITEEFLEIGQNNDLKFPLAEEKYVKAVIKFQKNVSETKYF